jgi:hypothetical protein
MREIVVGPSTTPPFLCGDARARRSSRAIALRLYLPKEWDGDASRRAKIDIPKDIRFCTKWEMTPEEIDRF